MNSRISARLSACPAPSNSCAVSSMPGEQNPHCAALRSTKAACSSASAPLSDSPSIVSTRLPSACTASIRQPRAILPSRSTEHAPHTPCSQPKMRAGEFEFLAQEIGKMLTRLDPAPDRRAVDHRVDLDLVLHRNAPEPAVNFGPFQMSAYVSIGRWTRHARARRGHPRLKTKFEPKTWMAGTSPRLSGTVRA